MATTTSGDSHVAILDPNAIRIGCTNDILQVRCASSAASDTDDALLNVSGAPAGSCPVCGNGVKEKGEVCDDGNTVSCDGCNNNCTVIEPLTCGDGIVCPPEQCDPGNGYCNPDCTLPRCGDGIVNISDASPFGLEYCDDGDATDCGLCNATCTGTSPADYCGDEIVCGEIWGETCDENDDANACTGNCNDTCDGPANTCGDGIVRCGEECDDGNTAGADGCGATCQDEPDIVQHLLGLLNTDPAKAVTNEGLLDFTNDRSVDLYSAAIILAPGNFTSLELLVTVVTPNLPGPVPCLPDLNLTLPLMPTAFPSLWTVAETRTGRSLPLCGGINQIVLRVRDENGAISDGVFRSVDSAWAEIISVVVPDANDPATPPHPALNGNGFLTRDDFWITGATNRSDLVMEVHREEGPDISFLPTYTSFGGGGYYSFDDVPIDGAGHDTVVGLRRPGYPCNYTSATGQCESITNTYTLDPDILLVPVDAWIILGPGETAGTARNVGADISADEAQAFFDPVWDPASASGPMMNGQDMIDSLWTQANIQFHVLNRTANIHAVNVPLEFATQPFNSQEYANCNTCATCNFPGGAGPVAGTNCTRCKIDQEGNSECNQCDDPAGIPRVCGSEFCCENCSNAGATACTVVSDRFFVHCCRFGFRPAVNSNPPYEPQGECCHAQSPNCGNVDNSFPPQEGIDACSVQGTDIAEYSLFGARLVGRTAGAMNVYFTQWMDQAGGLGRGGHGDRLALTFKSNIIMSEGLAGNRHVMAHEAGHFLSLSHVCRRRNPAVRGVCCAIRPNLDCSDNDAAPCMSTNLATGPPFGKIFGAGASDTCLNNGICLVDDDQRCDPNPALNGCEADPASDNMIMSQTSCEGTGVEFDQINYFEISTARQTILSSCIIQPDSANNCLLELNP